MASQVLRLHRIGPKPEIYKPDLQAVNERIEVDKSGEARQGGEVGVRGLVL
jgi:hypothetical protein